MHKLFIISIVVLSLQTTLFAQDSLQLTPPQANFDRIIFKDSCKISFDFRQNGTTIKYTRDGSVPTLQSSSYVQPIQCRHAGTIKARVFGKDFLPSDVKTVTLLKPGKRIDSLQITAPSQQYKANGWKTLCDNKAGTIDFKTNWLGYQQEKIVIKIIFKKATLVKTIETGFLQAQGAWIFLPHRITIWDEKKTKVGELLLPDAVNPSAMNTIIQTIPVRNKSYRELLVEIEPLQQIPDWHEGKGNKPWTFIDEIFVR